VLAKKYLQLIFILAFGFLCLTENSYAANKPDGDCDIFAGKAEMVQPNQLPVGTTFWGFYKCSSCGLETSSKPSGNTVACANCGSTHTDEKFYAVSVGKVGVTQDQHADDKNSAQAASGKKWTCPSCSTSNFNTATACEQCGAPKPGSPHQYLGHEHEAIPSADQLVQKNPRFKGKKKIMMWAAAALVSTSAIIGIKWGFSSYEVTGTVAGTGWQHTVVVDKFTQTTDEDWANQVREQQPVMPQGGRGEVPGKFNIRNPHTAVHHYQSVQTGTETVQVPYDEPYTDTETQTVDNGNGSFTTQTVTVTRSRTAYRSETRPVYTQVPVYETKVDYDTFVWLENYRRNLKGDFPKDADPLPWPVVEAGPLERLRHFSEYKVILTYNDGKNKQSYEVTPATESDFRSWKPGSLYILVKNNFGMVLNIKPLNAEVSSETDF